MRANDAHGGEACNDALQRHDIVLWIRIVPAYTKVSKHTFLCRYCHAGFFHERRKEQERFLVLFAYNFLFSSLSINVVLSTATWSIVLKRMNLFATMLLILMQWKKFICLQSNVFKIRKNGYAHKINPYQCFGREWGPPVTTSWQIAFLPT